MLKGIIFTTKIGETFIQYLESFRTPESPYVKESALIKKRPLSAYYIKMNHADLKRHIASHVKIPELFPCDCHALLRYIFSLVVKNDA